MAKRLGYDYEIIYKKGHDNVVADALSRQFEDEGTLQSISLPIPNWIEEDCKEWFSCPSLSQLINNLREDPNSSADYFSKDDILHYKVQVVISPTSTLRTHILEEFHSSTTTGHSGFQKIYAFTCRSFFWTGMKNGILNFVAECDVCQNNKEEIIKLPRKLQPFPLPISVWMDVSMDFITGLPKSRNK